MDKDMYKMIMCILLLSILSVGYVIFWSVEDIKTGISNIKRDNELLFYKELAEQEYIESSGVDYCTLEYVTCKELVEIDSSNHKSSLLKTFMPFTSITDESSKQYPLVYSTTKRNEYGILIKDGFMLVAMYYDGVNVGDELKITLSSGEELFVMIGDIKHEGYSSKDGSHIEFIVDYKYFDESIRYTENGFDSIYSGYIEKIEIYK